MLSGDAPLLEVGSHGTRHTDSHTSASSGFPLARVCTASTDAVLSVALRSMVFPTAHFGFPAVQRVSAASRSWRVLVDAGSQTAEPNQAVELTLSARHAGCLPRGLGVAAVTPR